MGRQRVPATKGVKLSFIARGDYLRGKTVLLTGGTGLIGGELLRRMLEMGSRGPRKIFCLVRSPTVTQARQKLLNRLDFLDSCDDRDGFTPVTGDIIKPGMDLDSKSAATLRSSIDVIIHCAAHTYFLHRKACEAINVEGVSNLLKFAAASEKPLLFVYFGSAAACGTRRDVYLGEEDYPRPEDRHFVHYTRTKAAAENLLDHQKWVSNLLILRPSIVLPDNLPDRFLAHEILWALVLLKEISYLPVGSELRVDAVPLSFVGECALRLIAKPQRRYSCYHISAGRRSPAIWREVVAMFRDQYQAEIRCCGRDDWEKAERLSTPRQKKLLRAIYWYLPFINQNVLFCNNRLYRELGEPAPRFHHFQSYLPRLLSKISVDEALLQSRDP